MFIKQNNATLVAPLISDHFACDRYQAHYNTNTGDPLVSSTIISSASS